LANKFHLSDNENNPPVTDAYGCKKQKTRETAGLYFEIE
jgi:hypothetical protein